MMKTPSQAILDKANNIASGCIDDWDGEPPGATPYEPGTTPFDYACRALALLTSAVKAEREEGKQIVRKWRQKAITHATAE